MHAAHNILITHVRAQAWTHERILRTCRIQNLDIPRAGRGGAAHGGAAVRSGAGQDGTQTGRFAQETTFPLAPKTTRAWRTTVLNVFGSMNKRNPI